MENKFRITECELVGNDTTLNGKFSLLNGSPVIEYYESVRSPSISINVSFRDTDGVVSNESIMGGEYLNLNVEFAEFGSFKLDPIKHRMMVNAVEMLKQSQVIRQHHWSSSLLRQLSMRLQESIEDLLVIFHRPYQD